MAPMNNSCEYEPWQNPAEGPWKTLTAASRQFLLRGFGDDNPDSQAYWPYSHQQAADVENAIKGIGRISRLRTPFCLAYAKTPACFRDGKLPPQAEACMHLGYSRTKPGYVLEVLEGPRKGRVITTSQVKFREDVFPMRDQVRIPQVHNTLWYDIDQEEEGASPVRTTLTVRTTLRMPSRTRSPTVPEMTMNNPTMTPSPRTCHLQTPRDQGPAVTQLSRTGGRCIGRTTSASTRARNS